MLGLDKEVLFGVGFEPTVVNFPIGIELG